VKRVLSSVRLVPPRSCGRPRPTCRAPGIWLLRAHPRLWCRQCKHTTRNDPADAAPSWSGCSTAPSSSPPTPSSVRAGGSPGRPPPTAASPRHRTATPTDWAGSCSAAPFLRTILRTRSCTIGVASMPAGIPTICSSLPTPRIWRTGARRTASADTRCQAPTYASTQGLERGAAVSAAPHTSERFASATRSARRRPSDQDDDEMRRNLASPITVVMLTNPLLL
jgi:hypothetical protein